MKCDLWDRGHLTIFNMTGIIIHESKHVSTHIWNGHLGQLVDERTLTFFPTEWLGTTKNTIVVGSVQSGKTAYILDLISKILQKGAVPILIASDKKSVLDQYNTRFSNTMLTQIKELKSKTIVEAENFYQPIIYTSILSSMRLKKIKELIDYGIRYYKKNFVLIIDEGDMSIKDNNCQLENIQRSMDMLGKYLKRIYITATPFAVLNSKDISPHIEEFTVVPSNYYQKLEYRDYFSMHKHTTDIVDIIANKKEEELTDEIIYNFAIYLNNALLTANVSITQPNIGLLKLFHENFKKHILALKLSYYIPNLCILVYTGEGCKFYNNNLVVKEWKNGICISRILQELKDSNIYLPILIISYNMAGRAETFKSKDHIWTLTHFFISVPYNSSVEQTVQSMRCNGQYKLTDPIIQVYASQRSQDRLEKLLVNNDQYVKSLNSLFKHYGKINTRESIYYIAFLQVPHFKFSTRKGIDDIKILNNDDHGYSKDVNCCLELAQYLVAKNNCIGYELVTEYHFYITRDDIINNINNADILNAFKNPSPDAFKFKPHAQNLLRVFIQSKFSHLQIKGCQIGYYNERAKQLNKLNHLKTGSEFKSQAVAEILPNGDIGVVIYKEDYYNTPEIYINKVLIWLDPQKVYHLHVNKPDVSHKLMFLTHF